MSNTRLPGYIREECKWIVRGYRSVKKEFMEERRDIIEGGGARYTEYKAANGEERRAFLPGAHTASRTTEDKQLQLEGLEQKPCYKKMRAVEHARDRIGAGLPEPMRSQLKKAIMTNCENGREHPYARLDIVGVSERSFYRYREAFLWDIANELGYI